MHEDLLALIKIVEKGDVPFPDFAAKLLEKRICLDCGKPLGEEKPTRGCHYAHYRKLMRAVENNETTEAVVIVLFVYLFSSPVSASMVSPNASGQFSCARSMR